MFHALLTYKALRNKHFPQTKLEHHLKKQKSLPLTVPKQKGIFIFGEKLTKQMKNYEKQFGFSFSAECFIILGFRCISNYVGGMSAEC